MRIFHNPRCSKSRQCLELLNASGVEYQVVRYLENPPSESELFAVLSRLNEPAIAAIRTGDKEWHNLVVKPNTDDQAAVADLLAKYPRLLQRPIVDNGSIARICRPPELVLEII